MIKLKELINQLIYSRLGKCYVLSYQYVTRNENCKLVHGYITDKLGGTGRVIDHAWVEMGNTAFDPVLNKKYTK